MILFSCCGGGGGGVKGDRGQGLGGWRRHVLAEEVTGLDHAIFIKRLLTRPGECNVKWAMFILLE